MMGEYLYEIVVLAFCFRYLFSFGSESFEHNRSDLSVDQSHDIHDKWVENCFHVVSK